MRKIVIRGNYVISNCFHCDYCERPAVKLQTPLTVQHYYHCTKMMMIVEASHIPVDCPLIDKNISIIEILPSNYKKFMEDFAEIETTLQRENIAGFISNGNCVLNTPQITSAVKTILMEYLV